MADIRVPYPPEKGLRCSCRQCPVQSKSRCAEEKKKKMDEMFKSGEKFAPNAENLVLFYCSIGKAACNDMDFNEVCICPNCPVWKRYDLGNAKPMIYYCRDGRSE